MPAPKPKKREEEKEDWLVTYADAITLLMAFFVMLLTFAEYDIPSFENAAAAIAEEVGGREQTTPTLQLQIDIQDIVAEMESDLVVVVTKDRKGLVIELASNAFFKPGSADINEAAVPVLEGIVKTIAAPRYDYYMIEVEGHTDDDPISTEKFPSNWELSGGRASRVVRFFEEQGFLSGRLRATGYGSTRPKVPNRNEAGEPIPDNQALNRRVNIRVTPMSLEEQDRFRAMGMRTVIEQDTSQRLEQMTEETQAEQGGSQGNNATAVEQFQQGFGQ
ncbi:MAG: OmpA family protein [Rhodospirillales bacterium]